MAQWSCDTSQDSEPFQAKNNQKFLQLQPLETEAQ